MSDIQERDRLESAREQGQAQFDNVREMVEALRDARDPADPAIILATAIEEAEQAIHEDALSIEVRSGWYSPGAPHADTEPAEYRILLCTGGPAVQVVGDLGEFGEPETARLQVQDWFQPWTDFCPTMNAAGDVTPEEVLLDYARCFYFGE